MRTPPAKLSIVAAFLMSVQYVAVPLSPLPVIAHATHTLAHLHGPIESISESIESKRIDSCSE